VSSSQCSFATTVVMCFMSLQRTGPVLSCLMCNLEFCDLEGQCLGKLRIQFSWSFQMQQLTPSVNCLGVFLGEFMA
jgi:hypothetical protein